MEAEVLQAEGGVAQAGAGRGHFGNCPEMQGGWGEGGANVKGGSGVPLKVSGKVSEGA